jgi:hypothetical protein
MAPPSKTLSVKAMPAKVLPEIPPAGSLKLDKETAFVKILQRYCI